MRLSWGWDWAAAHVASRKTAVTRIKVRMVVAKNVSDSFSETLTVESAWPLSRGVIPNNGEAAVRDPTWTEDLMLWVELARCMRHGNPTSVVAGTCTS
jgi:hypothetical protein